MLPLWRRSRASSSKVSKSPRRSNHLALEALEPRDVPAVDIVSFSAPQTSSNDTSAATPLGSISDNGQFVVYISDSTNLVANQVDSANTDDVFLYDKVNNTTRMISRAAGTTVTAANAKSYTPTISGDGNWVAFVSEATNLVTGVSFNSTPYHVYLYSVQSDAIELVTYKAGTTNQSASTDVGTATAMPSLSYDGRYLAFVAEMPGFLDLIPDQGTTSNEFSIDDPQDAFLYDRTAAAGNRLRLVSHIPSNVLTGANDPTTLVTVSGDGNKVLFTSYGRNLGQTEGETFSSSPDLFLYDIATQTVTLVTHTVADPNFSAASQSDQDFYPASISDDGRYVAYASRSNTLVNGFTDGASSYDVFLYDAQLGSGTNILLSKSGTTAVGTEYNLFTGDRPVVNGDGTHVVFISAGSNIVSGVTGGTPNVYRYSIANQTYDLVSHTAGSATTAASGRNASISDDGRYVAYVSTTTNFSILNPDVFATADVYRYDGSDGSLTLVSHSTAGDTTASGGGNSLPSISGDGATVAWNSIATNLITNDVNGTVQDVYIASFGGETPPPGPSGINITTTNVPASPNTTFATLSTVGGGPNSTFIYTLPTGMGNNNLFTITGNTIATGPNFTFQPTYTITVNSLIQGTTLSVNQTFTLNLINAPNNLNLSNLNVPASPNTTFSQFTYTGQNTSYTVSLVPGFGNNNLFTLSPTGQLSTNNLFPPSGQNTFNVQINVVDNQFPTLSANSTFTLTLVVQPTGINSNTTLVPALPNTTFGQLTTTGGTAGQNYTFSLVNGPGDGNNNLFTINPTTGAISTNSTVPTGSTLSILVQATNTLFPTLSVIQNLTFNLLTAPTSVVISSNTIPPTPNTTVGTVSVPGSNQNYTFTLVSGPGDANNNLFTIDPVTGVLSTNSTFPNTVPATYSVLVQAANATFPGLFTNTVFSVSTVNAPPPPTVTSPNTLNVIETVPTAVNITVEPGDASSVVTVTISGVPTNATFSAGTNNGGGNWTFTPSQLVGLTVSVIDDGTFNLVVAATASYPGGGSTTSANSTVQVAVANAPPIITVTAPSAINPIDPTTVNVTVVNVGIDLVQSVTIDWGDGTVQTFAAGGGSFTHQYPMAAGSYNVLVSVTDEDGTFGAGATAVNAQFASIQQAITIDLFQSLWGMTPSAGQIGALSSALAAGVPLPAVVSFFLNTDLYRINAINNLYLQYLGRPAGGLDLALNLPAFTSGGAPAVTANILGSVEFFLQSGGTPQSYVQAVATAVYGAPFDPAATDFFAAALLTGRTSLPALAQQLVLNPFGVAYFLADTYEAVTGSPIDPLALIAFAPVELGNPDTLLEILLGTGAGGARLMGA